MERARRKLPFRARSQSGRVPFLLAREPITAFPGYEKVRQGNIFFAGEHCSADYQGFMKGGTAEGARTARAVLEQIRGKKA